jgi:hypothetical protein
MPAPGWTNPITVPAGHTQSGVDPRRLLPSRPDLIRSRLDVQARLLWAGTPRFTPVQVTTDGVIFDGHHAVRAAAEAGGLMDVKVVAFPVPAAADSILDLPVV